MNQARSRLRGRGHSPGRRAALAQLAAASVFALTPARLLRAAEAPRFKTDPFTLGVASGYPGSDSVVLWTRLALQPLAPGGGMGADVVPVEWELAADERFRRIVQRGTTHAEPDWAHSVHVEPVGLEPSTRYWYRFTAGGQQSAVGRTRTAPAAGTDPGRLRLAVASCQQYEHGYYGAYRHMLDDDLDLVVHVGDYIYERSWGSNPVRRHGAPECYTLDDYRARHALYRGDRDLQAAHAAYPWMVTWDDHEVDNDYANDVSEENDDPALFLARRAAGYKAYYEHLPLPRRAVPFGPNLRLYRAQAFGGLVNLLMLDERQYRAPQACPRPGRRGSNRVTDCAALFDPARSKLGARQEEWLAAELAASKAQWTLLAQGTVMAHMDEQPGPGQRYWTDGWNGYPVARDRLLDTLATTKAPNPVVLSGDIHAFVVANLNQRAAELDSPVVASELTTTSISSQGAPQKAVDERLPENPNLLLANSERRGYLLLDADRERLQAELVAMESVGPAGRRARDARDVRRRGRQAGAPCAPDAARPVRRQRAA
jgi:alkaline phosphatase D